MKKTSRTHSVPWAALFAAFVLSAAVFAACGKQSTEALRIQLTNVPSTLTINQSVNLTASVGNDSANKGVDWTCSGDCGSFAQSHTASGASNAFTAPATEGSVTITASAAADHSVKATATITIVPIGSNAKLNGRYVFQIQGADSKGNYAAAGTIVADGAGNITGGEQDYTDASFQAEPASLTGTYAIAENGLGSITITVNSTSLPNNGVETFSIALTSTSHALIIQFDGSATSSGTLDLQSASAVDAAAISGPFAFAAQGVDFNYQYPIVYGGRAVLNASSGQITSSTFHSNDGGATATDSPTGTMTGPDAFGRGTLSFTNGVNFAYYAVQGQVLRILERDVPYFIAGGSMFGQGTAGAGSTFSSTALTGNYVIALAGATTSGTLGLAGQFTANGSGGLTTGFADTNNGGTATAGSIAGAAVYSIAADGTGTLTLPGTSTTTQDVSSLLIFAIDPGLNILDPNNPAGGGGALVMDNDPHALGTGYIVPQTSGPFQGNYGIGIQSFAKAGETDWVAQSVAENGSLTGTADLNEVGTTTTGVALTGLYVADAVNPGRFTGTLALAGAGRQVVYYQVSAGVFVVLEIDSSAIATGLMQAE